MTKLKCFAIDDEPSATNSLRYLINEYCSDKGEWLGCSNDYAEALEYMNENEPDLLFLDINLGNKSGFDLLKSMNENKHTKVIMVTAYDEYAIEAFKHSAVNYLLKPLDPEELKAAINKVVIKSEEAPAAHIAHLLKTRENRLFIPNKNGWEMYEIKDIIYLKGEGSYTVVYIENKTMQIVSKNLKFFEAHLDGIDSFMRVQKSFIINTLHIKRFLRKDGGTIEMTDGTMIPVSIQLKDDIMSKLGLGQ